MATNNTSGLASVTHPTGATAVAVLAAGAAVISTNPPTTWYGWLLAGISAVFAGYGVVAPKASTTLPTS